MDFSEIPSKNYPLALFEYCVRVVRTKGKMNATCTHLEWAYIIFGDKKKPLERKELMSFVKHKYSKYFSETLNYMFLEDKIRENFPEFFDISIAN